jgi:hypothetical protein
MFVGRCLLIFLTRQFLIWYMFLKNNVKMATIDECIEFALKNIGLWWRYGISRHCDEWKYIIIGLNFNGNIENCLKYNFIKLLCNWHVKSSAIYTPNAYEVSSYDWVNLQKIGCAVIWNYFRLLMLKVVPDISRP